MCHFCLRLWLFDMAPQSGQGKKESVIWAVVQLGFLASEAARCFHVSEMSARRWVQNYQRSGNFGRKAGSGGWKISTPEQDARLEGEGNPFHTAFTLKVVVKFSRPRAEREKMFKGR